MTPTMTPTDHTLQILNRMLTLDYAATHDLVSHRVEINEELAADESLPIVAAVQDGKVMMGCLGILNGVLQSLDAPKVCSVMDPDGRIVGFREYRETK